MNTARSMIFDTGLAPCPTAAAPGGGAHPAAPARPARAGACDAPPTGRRRHDRGLGAGRVRRRGAVAAGRFRRAGGAVRAQRRCSSTGCRRLLPSAVGGRRRVLSAAHRTRGAPARPTSRTWVSPWPQLVPPCRRRRSRHEDPNCHRHGHRCREDHRHRGAGSRGRRRGPAGGGGQAGADRVGAGGAGQRHRGGRATQRGDRVPRTGAPSRPALTGSRGPGGRTSAGGHDRHSALDHRSRPDRRPAAGRRRRRVARALRRPGPHDRRSRQEPAGRRGGGGRPGVGHPQPHRAHAGGVAPPPTPARGRRARVLANRAGSRVPAEPDRPADDHRRIIGRGAARGCGPAGPAGLPVPRGPGWDLASAASSMGPSQSRQAQRPSRRPTRPRRATDPGDTQTTDRSRPSA